MKGTAALMAVSLMTVAMLGVAGCGGKGKDEGGKTAPQVIQGVTVQAVTEEKIADRQEAVGTVRARNAFALAARIPGTVSSVLVKEGDRVAKGKLLLTLDAAESTSGAASAQAGVEEARYGVVEARARRQLADATFERYHKLFVEQAVTRQEFDSRQTEKEVAAQGLARAEARLVQAREAARTAGAVAGYTRITSPLAGIITGKSADVGMTVFPGTPLLTVEGEGGYRLEAAAPESLLGTVRTGQQVSVTIDGIAGILSGAVAEVVPISDPASRTFTVKVDISAKGLRSGAYGRVEFPTGSHPGILVPKTAVVERGALTSLWVVEKDKTVRMRLVKTGKIYGDKVEVLSGLTAGEAIVTAGREKVVDGARVE